MSIATPTIDRIALLDWMLPHCLPSRLALLYRRSDGELSPGWTANAEDSQRAVEAWRQGTLDAEVFRSANQQGNTYEIRRAERLGLVPHCAGAVRIFCLDLDDHGGDGGNVSLLDSLRRFFGADPVVFTSKGGRGLHCFFALGEPLPVARFVDWAKAWGFNRSGAPELFPKSPKLSQAWLPNAPNERGGDTYRCGSFDSCIVESLSAPPSVRLSTRALDFLRGGVRPGKRNAELNAAAFELAKRGFARGEAWRLCEIGATVCGLLADEPDQTATTFASGFEAGQRERGASARDARPLEPNRPRIVVSLDEERMTSEAIAALAKLPRDENGVYQRGGYLARIVPSAPKGRGIERPDGAPTIEPIPLASLREKIASAALFVKRDAKGELVPTRVPDSVVRAAHARGFWQEIPTLEAVVEIPILRRDGSVVSTPGYDEATGVYLHWTGEALPQIPADPTPDDALAARDTLLDLVVDFPFTQNEAKAAWLATLLGPFARFAFLGSVPLALIDGNAPGIGKGLLADVIATICTSVGIPCMPYPADNAELEKRITSLLIGGELLVKIDNVTGHLGGSVLDALLTASTWKGRELGKSTMTGTLPNNLLPICTANNAVLVGDTPRRCLSIRLEVAAQNPETRGGFKYPELLDHVRRRRAELAAACVTILRAFHVAGMPDQELPPWGSFEKWSALIRNAVVWVGMDDPALTRLELYQHVGGEAETLHQLVAAWLELDPQGHGLTVVEALTKLAATPGQYAVAQAAFAEVFGHRVERPATAKTIGRRLAGFRRRVVVTQHHGSDVGFRIDHREDRNGVKHWFVEPA